MEKLVLDFWDRSVSAGWLILAVILLRLVLKKTPKSVHCLLWLLVGVRLVCPFSIQSAASLIPSKEVIPVIPQAVITKTEPVPDISTGSAGITAFNSPVNGHTAGNSHVEGVAGVKGYVEGIAGPAAPVKRTLSIGLIFAYVWLAGAALMLLWALVSWLRLKQRVAEAVPDSGGIWLCDSVASPFLLGIFRPRIYLPPGLDGDSRDYVIAHEKAHIKRLDHLTKPAGFLLLSVYWFQPLVWLAYVLLCRDIELACDERVIRELGTECKKPYSEALLQYSIKQGGSAVCPLAFGEVGVKERVKNVLHYKKPAFWTIAASLAVCVIAAVCFLTDPVTPDKELDSAIQNAETVPLSHHTEQSSYHHETEQTGYHHETACYHHENHGFDECYGAYSVGASRYQSPSYTDNVLSQNPDITLSDHYLTLTDFDGTVTCRLTETTRYTPEEFYALFPGLLLPENTEAVACDTFRSAEPDANGDFFTTCVWSVKEKNAEYFAYAWIGDTRCLYDLVFDHELYGTYITGAPMYQSPSFTGNMLSQRPSITWSDDKLTLTEMDGTLTTCSLVETNQYTPEEFYALFSSDLRQQEASCGCTLLLGNTEVVARNTYRSIEPDAKGNFFTTCIWAVREKNAEYFSLKWVGDTECLYDLINNHDSQGPLCYDSCVLWDYIPNVSTMIPIRFDLEGPLVILAKSGTLFSMVNGQLQDRQTARLEIEAGETIYWQPFTKGEPADKAELSYLYSLGDNRKAQDTLELRSITFRGQGLYGAKTYGLDNFWGKWGLGGITVREYVYSEMKTDVETGELVLCPSDTPYRNKDINFDLPPVVRGERLPPKAISAKVK